MPFYKEHQDILDSKYQNEEEKKTPIYLPLWRDKESQKIAFTHVDLCALTSEVHEPNGKKHTIRKLIRAVDVEGHMEDLLIPNPFAEDLPTLQTFYEEVRLSLIV